MPLNSRSHGANPEKLYRTLGLPQPDKVIDFSTNTNVLPWNGDLDIDLYRCLAFYPDDEAAELRGLLAEREGCAPENILIVNGSNEAVYLLASFLCGKKTDILQPVYGEYLRALSAYGAQTRNIFSLNELSNDTDALFLCNPCNPTGAYISSEKLEELFLKYPETLFVVDEAYMDFLVGDDRKLDFERYENVVVLRSLTKIFHLCGARAGYVMSGEKRISQLKSRQPTWSVNALAQAAAAAFVKDVGFVQKTRAFYASETPRFIAEIEKTGYRVLPTRTHFFLVEVGGSTQTGDDAVLIRYLLERGLAVRHTRNFPGLDGRFIRVATRLREENEIFIQALFLNSNV